MSNTLIITQLKKFYEIKDELISRVVLAQNHVSGSASITMMPRKANRIYVRCVVYELHSIQIEIEYKRKLLIASYYFNEPNIIEYQILTEWTDDEILSGGDEFFIEIDVDEGVFFQQSLINDFGFLTYKEHSELIKYIKILHSDYIKQKNENTRTD